MNLELLKVDEPSGTPVLRRLAMLRRIRYQLGGALALGIAAPFLTLPKLRLGDDPTNYTMASVSIAIILSFVIMRQLTRYPGVIRMSYVLASHVAAFAMVLAAVFFLRLGYSRIFFFSSFTLTAVWFHAVVFLEDRLGLTRFAVLPFGQAPGIVDTPGADWFVIDDPSARMAVGGVVADLRSDMPDEWEKFITDTALSGVPVYHYKQIAEALTGRVEIEHLSENTFGSLVPNILFLRMKRIFDIATAILMLPLLASVFIIVGIAIKADSSGPVFFRQERMGFRGKVFRIWKFRTMVEKHDGLAETRDNDARITRVGRFLRRTRIDELPQVLNIVDGDMSWVGPRPEAVSLSRRYEARLPYYRYRHIVHPGLTGWAQVNQGHVFRDDEVLSKLHYDFFYIKNFSVWMDILIMLKTVRIVLTGFGSR